MFIHVNAPIEDYGGVIVFDGTTPDGRGVEFAVDHEPAATLLAFLATGANVSVKVPRWSVLSIELQGRN